MLKEAPPALDDDSAAEEEEEDGVAMGVPNAEPEEELVDEAKVGIGWMDVGVIC